MLLTGCVKLSLPGTSFQGPLPPADEDLLQSAVRVDAMVTTLADEIGPRSCSGQPSSLITAMNTVGGWFEEQGWQVRRQLVDITVCKTANLIATLPGTEPDLEPVVVGAHYDTHRDTPGADDNASGVAALLEISRAMKGDHPRRTVHFVAWTTEEPPFFATDAMGSVWHAEEVGPVRAALSIETVGVYEQDRHTQHYPFPLSLFYPSTGDFVAFVADIRSRKLVSEAGRSFREAEDFPTRGGAAPRWLRGIDWSDHRSYARDGSPALMVTDTAVFRNMEYHRPGDLEIDPLAVARVSRGLVAVVRDLAEAQSSGSPVSTGSSEQAPSSSQGSTGRAR
ncbi:MAG: M20/M25/M40 family metallo-hydrolase [Alphaproteobacteria bacterium]|nr:M20/M25/M40 family metallo-hydrolase [Alphaproteobacteria bacterium]